MAVVNGNGRTIVLNGTNSADTINGSAIGEIIAAGGDNDTVTGGGGNDAMDGGAGTDTAFFSGSVDSYRFSGLPGLLTVSGIDGTDLLTNFEFLNFGGKTYSTSGAIARFDTAATTENANVTIDVLANDLSLRAGSALRFQKLAGGNANVGDIVARTPEGANVVLAANNRLVVQMGNVYNDLDQSETKVTKFSYAIANGQTGGNATAEVALTITGQNDPLTFTTGTPSAALIEATPTAPGVSTSFVNFTKSDADGTPTYDTAGWSQVNATQWSRSGTYGSTVLDTNTNRITYTLDNARAATNALNTGDVRNDVFAVTVRQGPEAITRNVSFVVNGRTDPVVNTAPVAQNGTASGNEDTTITGSVMATDGQNNPLTYALVQGAQSTNGNPVSGLTFNTTNGTYSFKGPENFNGPVTFTYRANDGTLNSNVATVTINVAPVNDAPAVQNVAASVDEDTQITASVSATDVDTANLTYSLVQGATANGSPISGLTFEPNGTYKFKGPTDFNGTVTFTYKANDGSLDSNVATVTLTINPVEDNVAPVAQAASFTAFEDIIFTGSVVATDANDDALTYSLVQGARDSSNNPITGLTLGHSGSFIFLGPENFSGPVTFTYKANDGIVDSNVETVTINVRQLSDNPTVFPVEVVGNEDASSIPIAISYSDIENEELVRIRLDSLPEHGTLFLNGSPVAQTGQNKVWPPGNFHFIPEANWTGVTNFNFTVFDNGGGPGSATATITVNPVNDAPQTAAAPETSIGSEDTPVIGQLLSGTDVDGDSLTFKPGTTAPVGGTVSITPSGAYTFTPAANFSGAASFSYVVNDGLLDSAAEKIVNIAIGTDNDAPVAQDLAFSTTELVSITEAFGATDPENDDITYSVVQGPAQDKGTVVINPNGTFTFTSGTDFVAGSQESVT
ncbi:MAG: Ig-like domain-containing protein, partial [Microvirga sp.]